MGAMTPRPGRAGTRVPEHVRAALAARLGAESIQALARAAKTSESTLEDALTGGPLMPRTIARLEAFVATLEEASSP
jgi:hypothetical protein